MKTLKAREVERMRRENPDLLVINVLEAEEFDDRHIPGSANVPLSHRRFVSEVERLAGSKDRPVVVHCSSASCRSSPTAARKLEDAGFSDVRDFEGGIAEWKEVNLPLEGGAVTG